MKNVAQNILPYECFHLIDVNLPHLQDLSILFLHLHELFMCTQDMIILSRHFFGRFAEFKDWGMTLKVGILRCLCWEYRAVISLVHFATSRKSSVFFLLLIFK